MKILILNKKEEEILRNSLLNYYELFKYRLNKNDFKLISKFDIKIIKLLEKERGDKRCL